MGIPRFYRWISERYPLINQTISDTTLLPEFDNLYLDMNGIIHQCTHSDDQNMADGSMSEKDQILGIFTYIDRIVTHIVKPQQVLFLAVDGVAPRAKLNQQRSRRFRAGLDYMKLKAEKEQQALKDKEEGRLEGKESVDEGHTFDSNCITPGTEFMVRLSGHLKYFIRRKIKDDPLWQKLKIIFSGHEVPGEGEHKIMDYIRNSKGQPGYQPNTRHCMYGADADLMLLGLATHEPHFTLLREVVEWGRGFSNVNAKKIVMRQVKEQQWQMVHLSLMREYLKYDFSIPGISFYNLERILDDFIFMTFFIGNDFIPHSPTLDISENAIEVLIKVYCELVPKWGAYLTNAGKLVKAQYLEELFKVVGEMEEDILTKRAKEKEAWNRRNGVSFEEDATFEETMAADEQDDMERDFEDALLDALEHTTISEKKHDFEKDLLDTAVSMSGSGEFQTTKWLYYQKKFGIPRDQHQLLESVKTSYIEALLWCLEYYFKGVSSWTWFYPFHYAPMISDLTNLGDIISKTHFESGAPLKPFEQLMACLPSSSAHLVPASYRFLMTSSNSPIIHFYPPTFDVDMEGTRNPWGGVNLLPFIDTSKLSRAVEEYCPDSTLSTSERDRNQHGDVFIFRFDSSNIDNIKSTHPEAGLPDILACNSNMTRYTIPDAPQGGFRPVLVPGTKIPLPGFPSFEVLSLSSKTIKSVGLNCFGTATRCASMILTINRPNSKPTLDEVAMNTLGKIVHVNWPNLHEALVMAVSSSNGEYRLSNIHRAQHVATLPTFVSYNAKQIQTWTNNARGDSRTYTVGRGTPGSGGVDIGSIDYYVHVRPLQGMKTIALTGASCKQFGEEEAIVPYQLCVLQVCEADPRFEERGPMKLSTRFPINSSVVVTAGRYIGSQGVVCGYGKNETTLSLEVAVCENEPAFGHMIAQQIQDRYFPGQLLCKKLGISASTLGRIVGGLNLNPGRYNIGLNIKIKKQYMLPGYCRIKPQGDDQNANKAAWTGNNSVKIVGSEETSEVTDEDGYWEYTERTLHLIAAYKRKFPRVFQSMERFPFMKSYDVVEFLGKDGATMVEDIKKWLEQLETHKLTLVSASTQVMPPQAIVAVEHASNARRTINEDKTKLQKIDGFLPDQVFRPTGNSNYNASNLVTNVPVLGDRVVNLTAKSVPFGVKGTVVAVHPTSACVECLFDQEFVGGTTLGGVCSNYRGKLVPWTKLLKVSLSHPTTNRNQRNGWAQPRTNHSQDTSFGSFNGAERKDRPTTPQNSQPRSLSSLVIHGLKEQTPDVSPPSPSVLPQGDKMAALIQEWKSKPNELDRPVDTVGTSGYYHQLQSAHRSGLRSSQYERSAPISSTSSSNVIPKDLNKDIRSTSVSSVANPDEAFHFQQLLSKAFDGHRIAPPPPLPIATPSFAPSLPAMPPPSTTTQTTQPPPLPHSLPSESTFTRSERGQRGGGGGRGGERGRGARGPSGRGRGFGNGEGRRNPAGEMEGTAGPGEFKGRRSRGGGRGRSSDGVHVGVGGSVGAGAAASSPATSRPPPTHVPLKASTWKETGSQGTMTWRKNEKKPSLLVPAQLMKANKAAE